MEEGFDIQTYMAHAAEPLVADTVKVTLRDHEESAFMARFAAAGSKASKSGQNKIY